MSHSTNKLVLTSATLMLIIALAYSCNKDEKDGDEVTKSDRQKYEFSVPGVGFSTGCPTLVNNNIYIGTSSNLSHPPAPVNYFYKLNEKLEKIWEYPLENQQLRGPASLDSYGNIYFIVDSARTAAFANAPIKIYSLDNNGLFRWARTIGAFDQTPSMKCLAISDDNTIYAGGDTLIAFDIHGSVKWTYYNINIPAGINSAPIIDPNGNLFFAANNQVISLDKNGNERWTYTTPNAGPSSPAFTTDYSQLIIAVYRNIYSLQTSDGTLEWKYNFNINADFRSSPAVDDNNNIYIGSHGDGSEKDESTLYALKADGTEILWEYNLGSDIYSSPTLGDDRVVYIGSEGHGNTEDRHNRLHAFSMLNGSLIWSAELAKDATWGSPILSNSGMLYISTMYIPGEGPSGIYGFQIDATGLLPNCGSPTFQLSNAHNGRR